MKLDKDARKLTKQLFKSSFTEGRLDGQKVAAVARTVVTAKPRHTVGILKEYQRLVRMEVERHHAVIESAAEFDGGTREQLLASLREKYGPELTTEFRLTPELLGGVRIKVGSDVFDSSVRERLARLEADFVHG